MSGGRVTTGMNALGIPADAELSERSVQGLRNLSLPMQVGALCVQRGTGRVLLVTSRGTGRWIIPKGWPIAGRTLPGAALQEAWEEAGVRGEVGPELLGQFRYDKVRRRGSVVEIEVCVFRVAVRDLAPSWPEGLERRRTWFEPEDAARLVAEPGLAEIITRRR